MARVLDDDTLRRARMRAQRLVTRDGRPTGSVADVVRAVFALQAQDAGAAALGVRARSRGLTVADVEYARVEERSILRMWSLRGTLHLIPTEDAGWLLALYRPAAVAGNRTRREQLGLGPEVTERGTAALRAMLANGPLTRAEIADGLRSRGLPAEGQATIHHIARAAVEGVLCWGPNVDGQPTFVLLDDWVRLGAALAPEQAASELARRYLAAYGPARPEDFLAWSGLPAGLGRWGWRAIAGEALEVTLSDGGSAWLLASDAERLEEASSGGGPAVRLVPSFDGYLLGYRGRGLALSSAFTSFIYPGGGILRPAVMRDGRVIGRWRTERRRGSVQVVAEPFEGTFDTATVSALEVEAADVARFLGAPHGALQLQALSTAAP